jgi:hypothetical protein
MYYNNEAQKKQKEANRLIEGLTEVGAATTTSPRKGRITKENKIKILADLDKSLYKKSK